ncbi:MAG TPA: AAA family ATPase [Anaerolineae bacterium]|nr:AAA family ATPase [Anaerolineae bacterium]
MPQLTLAFLRTPQLELNGKPVSISRRKGIGLLAYLAVTRQTYTRDTLASLLWPEAPQARARAGLRQVLWQINKVLGKSWVVAEGDTVALNFNDDLYVDVHQFQQLLAECKTHGHSVEQACPTCLPLLQEAVEIYQGAFLHGFSLPDNAQFETWQHLQEEEFRRYVADCLRKITDHLIEVADFKTAIPHAKNWATLDPLSDAPHYKLMQLYLWTEQRSAAVHQYQNYAQLLKNQLGLQPQEDLLALYQRIQRGQLPQAPLATLNQIPTIPPTAPTTPTTPAPPSPTVAPQGEIRLTTVLVVGLSHMPHLDWQRQAEQMMGNSQKLLHVVTQITTQYEGQIVHFDGYSAQALFGMVHVHEDDPERGVHAALEIKTAAQQQHINLSIGIGTGHIYLGAINTARFQDVATLGPVVRLATKLRDNAQPNQILVSDTTYFFTQHAFEYKSLALTAVSDPQIKHVYVVQQQLLHPRKMRGIKGLRANLIGRDEELQKLKAAFANLLAGQGGQLVSLVGDAGLGKSRLIEELKQVVQTTTPHDTASPLWLESRCLELRTSTGFWPFIDLLQRYFYTVFDASSEAERKQALNLCLHQLHRQGAFVHNQSRVNQIKALLSNLLAVHDVETDEWVQGIDSKTLQLQTFQALYDFITALAFQRPVVIIFEDLHWVDDLSFDLLTVLMEALAAYPILILCVYRPHYQHKDLRVSAIASRKCPGRYTNLKLQELTTEQSFQLIKSLLSMEVLPPMLEQVVVQQTKGIPFFIEEVVRQLIEDGLLYMEDSQINQSSWWQVRDNLAEALTVPQSIQTIILSRVDHLSAELKQLLRSAAVIGYNFQIPILAELMPHIIDIKEALWQLEESALVYREKIVPQEEYVFKHILIQETVYQTVPPDQKALLHHQVAQVIEETFAHNLAEQYEQLAYHYQRSKSMEKAIRYLCLAGEKSRQIFLNNEAIRYFKQTLQQIEMAVAQTVTGQLVYAHWQRIALTGLGRTYHRIGQEEQARDYLQQAITISEESHVDRPTLIRLYHWLGEVFFWQAQYQKRAELGHKGLALLSAEDSESVEAALVYQLLAMSAFSQGDIEEFHRWTAQTAKFIEELPYLEELRPAYFHIAISHYHRKRPDKARRWLQTVEAWAEQHNDQSTLAEIYETRWSFDIQTGNFQTAAANVEQILTLYDKGVRNRRFWFSLQDIIWLYIHLGDFVTAEQYAQQGLEKANALVLDKYQSVSLLYQGFVQLCQQDLGEAISTMHEVILSTSDVYWWTEWIAHYCLGQLYHLQNRTHTALSHYQKSLTLFRTLYIPVAGWGDGWPLFAGLLAGLETCYEMIHGDNANFEQYCQSFKLPPHSANMPMPTQWVLKRSEQPLFMVETGPTFTDTFTTELSPSWNWQDPLADSQYQLSSGLQIRASNGRDIWQLNVSAPRLLQSVTATSFVAQTVCGPLAEVDHQPAMGGLLLWQDAYNYLRVVWGTRGRREVSFDGCVGDEAVVVGRGLLPTAITPSTPVWLRLTRQANLVEAFCSLDNQHWFTLGQTTFTATKALQIGVHAIGLIDRLIYPGAYHHGTQIQFKNFSLWY